MLRREWIVAMQERWHGPLWIVAHEPTGHILGFFLHGWQAKQICRRLNDAAVAPLSPTDYDGSQWEVDPTQ